MSNTHLVTAKGPKSHIRPVDIGAYQAMTAGSGVSIRSGCACSLYDANTVVVSPGELMVEGRHVRVEGETRLAIQSGVPGGNRNDLIVLHYKIDAAGNLDLAGEGELEAPSGIADMPMEVIPGTPVAGEPSDPAVITGSILEGAIEVMVPFAQIRVRGLAVEAPELLITRYDPFGVGTIIEAGEPFNPAQALGGTWEYLQSHGFEGLHRYKRIG